MGRKRMFEGNLPEDREVNEARKKCESVPELRETLISLEQEIQDIEARKESSLTPKEYALYDYMLSEKKSEHAVKLAELRKIIYSVMEIPHKKARAAVSEFYLGGKLLKEITDTSGNPLGINAARYYKKIGLQLLVLEMKKYDQKMLSENHTNGG